MVAILVWFVLPALVCARVRPSELEALLALYDSTSGTTWARNDHWSPDKDPCRKHGTLMPFKPGRSFNATPWHGVGCVDPCDDYLDGEDCTAGRVLSLTLRDNNLTGSTAGWHGLGEMVQLTHLDLSYNRISGSIPSQIGLIQHLDMLLLRNNALSGLLPPEIALVNAKGELREISLAKNRLSGTLPPALGGQAASLMSFDATDNHLSGTIPSQFASLSQLQVLYLRNNSLSGTLPVGLGGGIGEVGSGGEENGGLGLEKLRYLEAHSNARLSGTLPSSIGRMTHLYTLNLHGCALSGTLPTELGELSELRFLHLNDNLLSGTVPTQLGRLRNLETLDLYSNPLDGDVPSQIAELVNLRLLYLPNEQLSPLRMHYCQQRLPSLGKYSYRLIREEYQRFASAICPDAFDTLEAFGTLSQLSGDV